MGYTNQFRSDYRIDRNIHVKYNVAYTSDYDSDRPKISFTDEKIIHKKANTTQITIVRYKVLLNLGVGFYEFSVVGKARCSAKDTFDPKIGKRLASYRAQQKAYKKAARMALDVQQALSSNIKLINRFIDSLEYQCVRIPELD